MKRANRRSVRQLTDLTHGQLKRLRKILDATKGLTQPQAEDLFRIAAAARRMGRER